MRVGIIVTILTALLAPSVVRVLFGSMPVQAVLLGCGVSALNTVVALAVNRCAMGGPARHFLAWVLGGHGVRWGLLFGTLTGAWYAGMDRFAAFAVAVVVGDLLLMTGIVMNLYVRSLRGTERA
jgi:hypothetical protein